MHAHSHRGTGRVLQLSLLATLAYILLTLVAGIRANSLALISEAGHNMSDFLALLLSWVAVYLHERPPSSTKTYGYSRAGVLAAFVNALSLIGVAGIILYEAYERLAAPVQVQPRVMMVVAGIGVVMNAAIALALHRAHRDVNVRSVILHEVGDTLATLAIFVGGWSIATTGRYWIDSALSIAIGAGILWSSFSIIRETLNILLEGTPRGLKLADIEHEILASPGVMDVHDLHVWSIGSEVHALSCHIRIADIPPSASEAILREVKQRLEEKFRIDHTTIQFEHAVCDVAHGCVMPVGGGAHEGHRH
jgi:cobalt-zinc-cadmium efflux system protein